LGFVANFISEPVLIGFKAGIGVVIVVDQIPSTWNTFDKGSFIHNLLAIFSHLQNFDSNTLVGLIAMALLVGIEHFARAHLHL
jgi:MFS superfamily sulfate permease-like transporter